MFRGLWSILAIFRHVLKLSKKAKNCQFRPGEHVFHILDAQLTSIRKHSSVLYVNHVKINMTKIKWTEMRENALLEPTVAYIYKKRVLLV